MRFVTVSEFKEAIKNGIVLECKGQSPVLFIPKPTEDKATTFDLNPDTENGARLKGFATEYRLLCEKYNLCIDGCGCCGSPFMNEIEPTRLSEFLHDVNNIEPDNIERQVAYLIKQNIGKF